ncbi:hypothetical protein SKAU_G00041040 [Synaphobranchus kaupii]|uniref:Uncharacterized protein n=1 Tax=Synaphobranchus kaupii TaxID=118154 RepID=A0A9Q1G246_SYNKA|nr:hypothetical protein SKAU_G00041040 [Synaphobranchus kaupii]
MNASEQAVDEERKALQNEVAEVRAKLAEFQQAASEYRSSYSHKVLPLLLSGKPSPIQAFTLTSHDSEDVPILDQTEILSPEFSAPSTSAGTHLIRPSRSLLEVEDFATHSAASQILNGVIIFLQA